MSSRELVVLGTASQTPTRARNHNGYLLRWDGEALLFDPGEGTQRQMLLADVKAARPLTAPPLPPCHPATGNYPDCAACSRSIRV